MKQLFTYLFPAMIALLLSFSYASGQTDYKSEDDLKKQADVLFEKDDFTAALPLFSQLLSLYPNDADYNFKYGACALMSKPDKTESLRYLEYAAGRPNTDPRVFFYLGKAYHLNFRFTEAIDNYRKFKERAKPKVSAKLNTDRHITMCENGRQLLRNLTDLIVTGKKTLGLDDFYKAYDLSDYGGKLIRKPDDFKTALDKKMNDNSVMYLDDSASVIYFSSYGEKGKNGRDIYMAKRLPNGDWSKPANMGAPINTPYDEDFPFLHPSGDVFYFASKGHNSMGGYDIFKSYYDAVSHTWGVPVNQDFAINTPSDDYLYVTNSDETNACFASGRATDPKHVTVYNIKVKRIPLSLKIIKGRFTAYNTKSAKITVKDEATGQIAGIFNTDKNDGAYLINVPGSGKYKFIVETDESPVAYVGMVEIPDLQDFKPLFQEMKLIAKNGQEQLIINNLFDQLPESDNIELLASEVYKEKSELEVNEDQYERRTVLDEDLVASSEGSSENTDERKEVYGENTLEELKPEAMIVSAYKNAEALQQEADSLRKQSDLAFAVAANKKELASESADKAGQLISSSMEISDESERQEMIREANQLKKQSVKNSTQASAIYNLATKLDNQAKEKQNEAIASQKYAEEFESAINEPSSTASIEKLNQLKEALEMQGSSDAGIEPELKTSAQKAHVARENADKQLTYAFKLKNERKSLESHLNDLQNRLKESKKKKEKQDLEMQIDQATLELDDLRKDEQRAFKSAEHLENTARLMEAESEMLSEFAREMRSATEVALISNSEKEQLGSEIVAIQNTTGQFNEELAQAMENTTAQNNTPAEAESSKNVEKRQGENISDKYATDLASAENIHDEQERSAAKAGIYSNMLADIDNSIAELEQEKEAAGSKSEKKEAEKRISELRQEKENVQKAYDENLNAATRRDEDGLASNEIKESANPPNSADREEGIINGSESSQPEEEDDKQDNTTIVPPDEDMIAENSETEEEMASSSPLLENVTGQDHMAYAADFEAREQEISRIENEQDRTVAHAELYREWSAKINENISSLEAQKRAAASETETAAIDSRISELRNELAEKNAAVDRDFALLNESPGKEASFASTSDISADAAYSTAFIADEDVSEATGKWVSTAEDNSREADNLANEAGNLRNLASAEKNKKEREKLNSQAENKERESEAKRTEAKRAEVMASAVREAGNAALFNLGNQMESEKQLIVAAGLQDEADSLLEKSQALRDSASSAGKKKGRLALIEQAEVLEKKAAEKQNEADFADELALEMRTVENTVISKTLEDADEHIALPEETAALDEVGRAWAKNSEEFKNYAAKKWASKKLFRQADVLYGNATELENESNLQQELADNLRSAAEIENDPEKKQKQLDKAQQFSQEAKQKMARSDSLKKTVGQLKQQADVLSRDSEQYLAELHKKINLQLSVVATASSAKAEEKEQPLGTESEEQPDAGELRVENTAMNEDLLADAENSEPQNTSEEPDNTSSSDELEITPVTSNGIVEENETEVADTESSDYSTPPLTEPDNSTTEHITTDAIPSEDNDATGIPAAEKTFSNSPATMPADEIFERLEPTRSVYDDANPIPTVKEPASGLIYKVQVGAFRNPIPQNLFRGFKPIVAEKRGDGITRYQAGRFRKLSSANMAKDEIRSLGYADAFVVAFLDGKRVPVNNRETLETTENTTFITGSDVEHNRPVTNESSAPAEPATDDRTTESTSIVTTSGTPTETAQPGPFETYTNDVDGLYFTVQVGVFSKPVSKTELHNISPIKMERTPGGLYRYTSGQYKSPREASAARDRIIRSGVKDAFITAYYNGQRISIAQAIAMMNKTSTSATEVAHISDTGNTTETNNPESTEESPAFPSTHLSVQVGPYDGDVPVEEAGVILELSHHGVERLENADGLTIYSFGKFDNYEDVEALKNEIVQLGMHSAREIGVSDGEVVDVEEALEILEK